MLRIKPLRGENQRSYTYRVPCTVYTGTGMPTQLLTDIGGPIQYCATSCLTSGRNMFYQMGRMCRRVSAGVVVVVGVNTRFSRNHASKLHGTQIHILILACHFLPGGVAPEMRVPRVPDRFYRLCFCQGREKWKYRASTNFLAHAHE